MLTIETSFEKIYNSLDALSGRIKCDDEVLQKLLKLQFNNQESLNSILSYLNAKFLEKEYTLPISVSFPDIILLIVTSAIPLDYPDQSIVTYRRKCIALSKVCGRFDDVLRYTMKYFINKPAPFCNNDTNEDPNKKQRVKEYLITDLDILECSYNLLKCDPFFFKDLWDWSTILDTYSNSNCQKEKLFCNYISAILFSLKPTQVKILNDSIPEELLIEFDKSQNLFESKNKFSITQEETLTNKITWKIKTENVTNIEGVILPIHNKFNADFYNKTDGHYDRIVKVDSTKTNLRRIALGISCGKAVCLSGSVGSGKTTLVQYLARKTGRIYPSNSELEHWNSNLDQTKTIPEVCNGENKSEKHLTKKRKNNDNNENITVIDNDLNNKEIDSGNKDDSSFLRIQLGDQTDGKMLLGQYRCTDVPGEFIWLPGVLTKAVINGSWLLLEDLDSATQDTCTIINNLLEYNYLSVPGFSDCLKISPGFQLFVTIRTHKTSNSSQKAYFSLLDKYFYNVNIISLTRKELCQIISINFPKLETIANRISDVYLTFSSGEHENFNDYIPLPAEKISINSLGFNLSGRLVSTRDLIKLCQRSYPMFSVTNSECAYFVFQNAVDLFCSYLPQGINKTKLITSIGAKLGIIQSRCENLANDYKPEIQIDNIHIKAGRACLNRTIGNKRLNNDNLISVSKRSKLNENNEYSNCIQNEKSTTFSYSYTRIASCLVERIAVSIQQNEPVLLVGETGVGKTSSIQYLAEKTNHKLIVINMNNQSDVSDLIGGFKPVDLSYIIKPLRTEFELLFRKTFNEIKNEKFLSNISICYNSGEYIILIKLMMKIIDAVYKRTQYNNIENDKINNLNEWKILHTKLIKLNKQLKASMNISFAFISGSLVKSIENGNWVLLDEINLATTETLECLSTILEPDGSIILLERGDFKPIKRHTNFRIFACMNPNTDIGKKDLPLGIRNRFTEFYVDELTTDNDLMVLISDYLNNIGIKKIKIFDIVKLYKKLKTLSILDLNDGLGNRPVFSLRTLCRALKICSKNLCGSIDRNLYESFCLSFLTQLDTKSHNIVYELIKNTILNNSKAILSQNIPKPNDNYINFEGYWIEKGKNDIIDCNEYILTDSVKENLKSLSRIISIGKLPILLQGPTSAGKTSLIQYIAKKSGNLCLRINNHEHTDLQEYIGTYISDINGKLYFKEGILVDAMRNGSWIILDELNLASTEILEALNRVLDDNRELYIPETQNLIKAHPNFMLFATQNPPGLYGGRKTLSRAFKNRFIELHFSDIPKSELEIILEKRCLIPKSYSIKMVKCMSDIQINRKTTTIKNTFTLRDLFRWGNRYTYADKNLLIINLYDWNQHLVDEGYLVLSAKIRNPIELEIIENILYTNFRKKINLINLFTLNENTSLVTKDILERLFKYNKRNDIIWTQNMTRMAVLTAKALNFNEPILLVGTTGCGKTTICQILSDIYKKNLYILNCHMHTESSDFLGGLRPYRVNNDNNLEKKTLFEWIDGPLIESMLNGSYFLADEISLAEDSVLERLNCILETERTILLAEKCGINYNNENINEEFIIKAKNGFQFLATMNPGGDFGKKELSPALRNRFTEIWCIPSNDLNDLYKIIVNNLKINYIKKFQNDIENITSIFIDIINYLINKIDKFKFSIRDILSWINYICINTKNSLISIYDAIIYGLEIIFLDSFEILYNDNVENYKNLKNQILQYAIEIISKYYNIQLTLNDINNKRGKNVEILNNKFGIKPFYIKTKDIIIKENQNYFFETPTTKRNLFRLLSALTLNKAILLEGPPGVGKTSIVENLCKKIGFNIVRINLCEHTDLTDLFGTDLPAENNNLLTNDNNIDKKTDNLGKFIWHDGPLLAALKTNNTWILLDELNLAPQSVLEGLNAILDHRNEVFIPELNKKFLLGNKTRIFGCQNPLRQGGGRKGLPQSFLNRFTKVYLKKFKSNDLLYVVNNKYGSSIHKLFMYFNKYLQYITSNLSSLSYFEILNKINSFEYCEEIQLNNFPKFDLANRIVEFSEILDKAMINYEFGIKGGPYEINLRDILRWCESLFHPETGFILHKEYLNKNNSILKFQNIFNNFLLILFERMKLVYYQRMRNDIDKNFILNTFSKIFNCNAYDLNKLSKDISIYWTDSKLYLNDIIINRNSISNYFQENVDMNFGINTSILSKNLPLLLTCQRELLKNLAECVHLDKPIILCGPTNTGKSKLVDLFCQISNQYRNNDTIDDSVTGTFQQIDLNRHLEIVALEIEHIYIITAQKEILQKVTEINPKIIDLLQIWNKYSKLSRNANDTSKILSMSDEVELYKNRIIILIEILKILSTISLNENIKTTLNYFESILLSFMNIVKKTESLNMGGHFEWVDSKIVKAIKDGQYMLLEHSNLCSSAVLDRLNCVFEPEGSLLISEKGITSGCKPDIIKRHQNFRAFMTIDPKNGELSRAMRNRCIELSFSKDSYTIDDLRKLIYINGIKENYLIEATIKIYENIKLLTDFSTFDVSDLIKCSILTFSYLRIGFNNRDALYQSALDVYVNSTTNDILGYGLEYYLDKLKNIIDKVCNSLDIIENIGRFEYQILTCENLNTMTMIKLQCEPLRVLLKSYCNQNKCKQALSMLANNLGTLEIDLNIQFLKFYIYILYNSCTFEDIMLRHKYIKDLIKENIISDSNVTEQLLNLNVQLYDVTVYNLPKFDTNKLNIPWNSELFPRIRDYKSLNEKNTEIELSLNSSMLYYAIYEKTEENNKKKTKDMSAISYSQGVEIGLIMDNLDNELLKQLYVFINNIQNIFISTIEFKNIQYDNLIDLFIGFMWINRFIDCAKENLFIKRKLNSYLLDKLLLHFKWIEKYLIKILEKIYPDFRQKNQKFETSFKKIKNYNFSTRHPLSLNKKIYCKKLAIFQPLYTLEQIQIFKFINKLELFSEIDYVDGINFGQNLLNKKLKIIFSDQTKLLRNKIKQFPSNELKYIENINQITEINDKLDNDFIKCVQQNLQAFNTNNNNDTSFILNLEQFNGNVDYIWETFIQEDQIEALHLDIVSQILPLKEYFATKILTDISLNTSNANLLNFDYFESIPSLVYDFDILTKIINNPNFSLYEKLWSRILQYLNNSNNFTDLQNLITFLNENNYRNFSTFSRQILCKIQKIYLQSLANKTKLFYEQEIDNDLINSFNGPLLSDSVLLPFYEINGNPKSIKLNDLENWRISLNELHQIWWNNSILISKNYDFVFSNLRIYVAYAKKLLLEVDYIQKISNNIQNQNFSDCNEDFQKLIQAMRDETKIGEQLILAENSNAEHAIKNALQYSLICFLTGAIELSLVSYTPLVDPVEKNRLKAFYIRNNLKNLQQLNNVYDFMKIIMNYQNYGLNICNSIKEKIVYFENEENKFSKKLAVRPEINIYTELVHEINYYLKTNGEPKKLLILFADIKTCIENINHDKIKQIITRMNLWTVNSNRFLKKIMSNDFIYYLDFTKPLEYSIIMLRYGMEGLKSCLRQISSSVFKSCNINIGLDACRNLNIEIQDILKFPNLKGLNIFENKIYYKDGDSFFGESKGGIFSLLSKFENSRFLYFKLLKAKLLEIKTQFTFTQSNDNLFQEMDYLFSILNQIWQEEEEIKRKNFIEEESLYVTKKRCENENEEELEMEEIQNNFPTSVDEDFGEFIMRDTLEQVIKVQASKSNKQIQSIFESEDLQMIVKNFIFIMQSFSNLYYYKNTRNVPFEAIDIITSFQEKTSVFIQIFHKYHPCINQWIDKQLYNSFGLMIGMKSRIVDDGSNRETNVNSYNYYKDSNIDEIISCTEILDNIEKRLEIQLALYPDHAVLLDIIRIIQKLRTLPCTSPIVRFSTGFQILRQKLSMWNEVAHKGNNLNDLENKCAEYIKEWTRLELQHWRTCLSETFERLQSKSYKYWFFIYNLLHEYISSRAMHTIYNNFENAEKHIETGVSEEVKSNENINLNDIIKMLHQFIETANFADFSVRMNLLKSFEFYLHYISTDKYGAERKDELIAILHNIYIYFSQFTKHIENKIKEIKGPIEKKLRDFVKIESYNKDLSYFSMKNNISRSHRHLNKFLKEYRNLLNEKITMVFQQNLQSTENAYIVDYKHEEKLNCQKLIEKCENFLIKKELLDSYCFDNINNKGVLLLKIKKLFITSRNIVSEIVTKISYLNMLKELQQLLLDELETCNYLRKLEVDRSKEKNKQKAQAKQILTQKRKGLSDLFKQLSNIGMSYKAGLMEISTNSNLIDLKIEPFYFEDIFELPELNNCNLEHLRNNLDNYFAKCIFKLKSLQNILLAPKSEIGQQNIDRIKGFSIDMFIMVQNQRKNISMNIKDIVVLYTQIKCMKELAECINRKQTTDIGYSFNDSLKKLDEIRNSILKVQYVFTQFILLLNYQPKKLNENYYIFVTQNADLNEKNNYIRLTNEAEEIANKAKVISNELNVLKTANFINEYTINNILVKYENLIINIEHLRDQFKIDENDYLPQAQPLIELLTNVKHTELNITNSQVGEGLNEENIDKELENIIHGVLLPLQKIYKKHISSNDFNISNSNCTKEKNDEFILPNNYLKVKLYQELSSDFDLLNIQKIMHKLSNLFLSIKYSTYFTGKENIIKKIISLYPLMKQYAVLGEYILLQQIQVNRTSSKMLSIMLNVFIELCTNGFCIPLDLLQDEDIEMEKEQDGQKNEGGFGLEDGTGENDVSERIENEDQLDDAKKPEDYKNENNNDENSKEEKGIEMSENFDANMQDIEKPDENDDEGSTDNEEQPEKEMGETEEGAEKLDDQIWGSDEEDASEDDNLNEEDGKGSNEEKDDHNDLNNKNKGDSTNDNENQGLDAAAEDENNDDQRKKQKKDDIDEIPEQEYDEEQTNAHHNELEDPPEAEEMDLGNNCDLDENNPKNDDENNENPFDIDKMKENMEIDDETNDDNENDNLEEQNCDESKPQTDSDDDIEKDSKFDENNETEKNKEENENTDNKEDEESTDQNQKDIEEENNAKHEEKSENNEANKIPEDLLTSRDKSTKEENVQSGPEKKDKGSNDEVVDNNLSDTIEQTEALDSQDTGEEKEGIGHAENDENQKGHKGIAETKVSQVNEELMKKNEMQPNKNQSSAKEDRCLADSKESSNNRLKTIDKVDDGNSENTAEQQIEEESHADEYQHIKEAKTTDKITLDSATEEQSKQIQPNEEEKNDIENEEGYDELMDVDEKPEEEGIDISEIQSEKTNNKFKKPSKINEEEENEIFEINEKVEVEGDLTLTSEVLRGNETSAHMIKEILSDMELPEEQSAIESLEHRRLYNLQLSTKSTENPNSDDCSEWLIISNKMLNNARELCEQLRLILEPTKCTRLKGDYRTGKRINMKKIIPYIASQFRKDKIWLRRTKPAQRNYKITIAIDDSKSMHHNNSKYLTLQAISLVSQALTLLESGKLNVLSFGEIPNIIINHTEQFDGPKLMRILNFSQNQSKIAELLDFVRTINIEEGPDANNGIFENLVLILSDGRNIFSEGEQKVKNSIKRARLQRMFLVYIIIDNPENKHSILDIRVPHFSQDRKTITMKSYLDDFPFPYYVIVRDLDQLPLVLSEAMRQWFELVNSEQ